MTSVRREKSPNETKNFLVKGRYITMTNEDRELLELFKPLRVADVRDGMDWMGYHHYGTVDKNIRPLFRTKAVVSQKQLVTFRMKARLQPLPATTTPLGLTGSILKSAFILGQKTSKKGPLCASTLLALTLV